MSFVRVKDKATGHEYTVDETAVSDTAHELLADKPAVDRNGRPLPAKPNLPKGGTKPATTTSTSKESK